MKDEQRAACLRARRETLKEKIAAEQARSHPDEVGLHNMKRERLRLKDEIAAVERGTSAATAA